MLDADLTAGNYTFAFAFSNIDANAPDGIRGPVELEVRLQFAEP